MSGNRSDEPLEKALAILRGGDVVALPTETVYGLAADVTNAKAIDKIFAIKERPFFDPLIVHLAERSQAENVVSYFPPLAEKLAERFWPGPLTLILPKLEDLNPKITSGLETVGVRVPRHKVARELIRRLGRPLAAPSANKFGRTSPTSPAHVHSEFGDSVFVLDGGDCEVGIESTVVGFNEDFSELRIYRPGAVTAEMLGELAPVKMAASPAAPGQLEHHYMPSLPLVVLSSTPFVTEEIYNQLLWQLQVPFLHPSWMSLPADPIFAARLLYTNLRKAAEKPNAHCIVLPYNLMPAQDANENGLHAAIADRIKKAARIFV